MGKQPSIGTIAGVAIGAAAAGAAAVALSDKNNRKKLGKAVNDLTTQAQKLTKDLKKNPEVKKAVKKARPALKSVTRKAVETLS